MSKFPADVEAMAVEIFAKEDGGGMSDGEFHLACRCIMAERARGEARVRWILAEFKREEGVPLFYGHHEDMPERPSVFSEEEWLWLIKAAEESAT
jgi:hypothetical protein